MNLLLDFSTALVQARRRKQVTQEQVAFALGLSHATYNAWECGHRLCPYKHIIALISYFDDEQFTRSILRMLLMLQYNMAGPCNMSREETKMFYQKMIALLSDECDKWLSTTT